MLEFNPIEILVTEKVVKTILVILLLIFVFIFSIGFYLGRRRKKRTENKGEAAVRKLLTNYCTKTTAHLLNNVTLKYKDGTTQIDHILLTQNGILVIETKHYSGWLFANENQKLWTQILYKVRHKFQNPLLQNKGHVLATQKLLDFMQKEQIQGLVIFTGDATFKTNIPKGVVLLNEVEQYVDNIRFGDIAENMLQYCIGCLEYKRFELTEKTDFEHQVYLERKFGITD